MLQRSLGLVLASVLLFSSIQHLKNPYYFLGTVYSYELLSPQVGVWVASVVPLAQFVFSAMIFARLWESAVAVCVATMFATFFIAQSTALFRGLVIPCGCFGSENDTVIGWPTIALVLALLLMTLVYLHRCIAMQRVPKVSSN